MGGWTNLEFLKECEIKRKQALSRIPLFSVVKVEEHSGDTIRIAVAVFNDGNTLLVKDLWVYLGKLRKKEYSVHPNLCCLLNKNVEEIQKMKRMGRSILEIIDPEKWKKKKRKQIQLPFNTKQKELFKN